MKTAAQWAAISRKNTGINKNVCCAQNIHLQPFYKKKFGALFHREVDSLKQLSKKQGFYGIMTKILKRKKEEMGGAMNNY